MLQRIGLCIHVCILRYIFFFYFFLHTFLFVVPSTTKKAIDIVPASAFKFESQFEFFPFNPHSPVKDSTSHFSEEL